MPIRISILDFEYNIMSSDEVGFNQDDYGKSPAKKSIFNPSIIGIIILVGVAAFFAGTYTSELT